MRHILHIEDDPLNAKFVFSALRDKDTQVEHAHSLEKGLEAIDRLKPDAVILDLNLPDSQGMDTLAKVHDSHPRLPIIVMSGDMETEKDFCRVRTAGAVGCLSKMRHNRVSDIRQTVDDAIYNAPTALGLHEGMETIRWAIGLLRG